MGKMTANTATALLLAALGAAPALAGGFLETPDITGNVPSPLPGRVNGTLVRIFWDSRCLPVQYRVNNTQNPIPNPLGAPFLSLADATAVLQSSLDDWTQVPTSYISAGIAGTVANPGLRGFDMKNELTFRTAAGFTAIASSPSVSFISDVTLANGDDIDGDGDSDVSGTIATCADVDGDGDVEFPPGFYKAGTIIDNDVQFNVKASNGFRFTVQDAQADAVARSVDLKAVAIHELGHSFGLSHVLNNNKSATDGTATTMFPFIDTDDPAAELAQRTLDSDDIAWISYFYPEGSAASGPAALQAGDVAFNSVYGVIQGTVTHGVLNQPVAGASVAAYDRDTGELFASGFSGRGRVAYNPLTGGSAVVNAAYNILDGRFSIPVKKGNWVLSVEPVDGQPVPSGSISLTAQIGDIFGQQNFNEEYWNGNNEAALEKRSGESKNVHVNEGEVQTGVDIVTNREINIRNFGSRDFVGFTGSPGNRYYAVRIPASQISAVLPGQDIRIHAGVFDTFVWDNSTVPLWAEAMLTTGTPIAGGATATVNVANPLDGVTGFLAADNDFAPLYFKNPHELGYRVRREIEKGNITDLFLVLRLGPNPLPGISNFPALVGLDGGVAVNDVPINGLSYISDDGVTFNRVNNFNFRFGLVLSEEE